MRQGAPTLLVLAAGMGTRFGGLKQCEPMGPNGETLLDYSVFDAQRAGFCRVVFVIREELAEAFKTGVGSRYGDKCGVDYVHQHIDDLPDGFSVPPGRVKLWGTLHAVLAAREAVREPFAVINADDFYGPHAYRRVVDFFRTSASASTDKDHYCMVGYPVSQTLSDSGGVSRGICAGEGGLLRAVEEHCEIVGDAQGRCHGVNLRRERVEVPAQAVVSMNFWGFTPSIFDQMREHFVEFLRQHGSECNAECYIPSVIDTLIRSGRADCRILQSEDRWFGVTYPQDKATSVRSLRTLIADGTYPGVLWPRRFLSLKQSPGELE